MATARPAVDAGISGTWNLRGLSVISFAHGVSDFYSGLVPFTIFYALTNAHVSPVYQGALGFLWYLTSSIVQPLFGAYSDARGRWWFLPASVGLTAVAVSAMGATSSLFMLALCIVLGGLGSAIMHPEAGKYSAMLSGSRKASGVSIFQIGGQIGYSLGPAVVAILLARYGGSGTLFLIVPGLVAVAAVFAVMRGIDRSATRAYSAERAAASASSVVARVDRIGVGLLVTSTSLRYLTSAAFVTYLPNVLTAKGVSLAGSGQVVSAFLLVSAIGLFAGGWLSDRFGAVRVSIASLVASVPFFAAAFFVPLPFAVALLMVASVLLAVQNAPGVAIVQAMLPKNLGMALGLMNGVAFGLGSALVAVVGVVVAREGASSALGLVSAVPLGAALSTLLVRDRIPRAGGARISEFWSAQRASNSQPPTWKDGAPPN